MSKFAPEKPLSKEGGYLNRELYLGNFACTRDMEEMLTLEMQIANWTNYWRTPIQRNRMQESCSYGSVGERGGNEPLYPEEHTSEQILNFRATIE